MNWVEYQATRGNHKRALSVTSCLNYLFGKKNLSFGKYVSWYKILRYQQGSMFTLEIAQSSSIRPIL